MPKLPHFDRIKVEPRTNTIILTGEIDEKLVAEFNQALVLLPSKALTVMMNSEGGDVYQGFALYDLIRTYPRTTTAVAVGPIMSAAVLPYLACRKRITFENVRFMIHHGSVVLYGHTKEASQQMKDVDYLDDRYIALIAERTGMVQSRVRSWCKFGKFFGATEAVDNGFADGIIVPREMARSKRARRKNGSSSAKAKSKKRR